MIKNKSILLFGIILLGAFLRLYHFQSFDFYADSARDILVAKHMIEIEGFKNIGPGASAGWGLIHNSPLYFWMLSIFWFYLHSPLLISLVFAFFGIATIYIGYKAGSIMLNASTGLTLAFFISVSQLLISYSRSVYQPHLIPFITLLSVYSFTKTVQTRQPWWLIVYIQTVFVGLHTHYSFLPVFCVFSLWTVFLWVKLCKNGTVLAQLAPVVFYIAQLLFWINVTYVNTPFDQMYFLSAMFHRFRMSVDVSIPALRSNQIIYSLFSITSGGLLLLFIIVAGFLAGAINALKKKDYYVLLITSLVLSVAATSLYTDPEAPLELYTHYFSPYYILVLTLVAYLINRYISIILPKLFITCVFGYLLIRGYGLFNETPISRYATMEKISQTIYTDFKSLQQNDQSFVVFDHNPNEAQFDYYTGQYYYFLENYFSKPLVSLAVDDRNFLPITRNPSIYYLVCSWFPVNTGDRALQEACIHPFQIVFLANITFSGSQKIKSITSGNRSFHVFRFTAQHNASIAPKPNQYE